MEQLSPYHYMTQLEFLLQARRPDELAGHAVQKTFDELLRHVRLARHVIRDYDVSAAEEDTQEQLRLLPVVVQSIEMVRDFLLQAGSHDLMGAADIAQYSAGLETITARLR